MELDVAKCYKGDQTGVMIYDNGHLEECALQNIGANAEKKIKQEYFSVGMYHLGSQKIL